MKSEEAQMFLQKYTLVLVASATKQVLGVPAAHLMDLYLERFRSPQLHTDFAPETPPLPNTGGMANYPSPVWPLGIIPNELHPSPSY